MNFTPNLFLIILVTDSFFFSLLSDHAWGGNYFIAGGEVDGRKILGSYPDILSEDGPQIIEPGIVVPSTSWDALWNGVIEWFGITDTNVSVNFNVPSVVSLSAN